MQTKEEAAAELEALNWETVTGRKSLPMSGRRVLFEMNRPDHFRFYGIHIGKGVIRSLLHKKDFSFRCIKRWTYADRSTTD